MMKRYEEAQPLFYVKVDFDSLSFKQVFIIQECVVEEIKDEVAYIKNKDTGVITRHNVIHSNYSKLFFSRRDAENFVKNQLNNEEDV